MEFVIWFRPVTMNVHLISATGAFVLSLFAAACLQHLQMEERVVGVELATKEVEILF